MFKGLEGLDGLDGLEDLGGLEGLDGSTLMSSEIINHKSEIILPFNPVALILNFYF
jgi:hypothetical protein